jgi:hypothetical protein
MVGFLGSSTVSTLHKDFINGVHVISISLIHVYIRHKLKLLKVLGSLNLSAEEHSLHQILFGEAVNRARKEHIY